MCNRTRHPRMKILFIAPQPFFENRGTPIAVRNMLLAVGKLGHETDLITYYAGQSVSIPGSRIFRCMELPFKRIPIGFSPLKLLLDPLLYAAVIRRLLARQYDVIQCVEEGIFLGLLAAPRRGAMVCYDMDSSMAEQLTARGRIWRLFAPVFRAVEGWAIRKSACIVTVCPALAEHARKVSGKRPIFQIEDVPIVHREELPAPREKELRDRFSLHGRRTVVYIGNFESYQGIDLLFKAFAVVVGREPECVLILVGGAGKEVLTKKKLARSLGIERNVLFTGFVPPEKAGVYLSLADIVVSPRVRGTNFPMKVYSYLASGKPLVATDLPVHSQILNHEIALLAPATAEGLSEGILRLLANPGLGASLAERAGRFVEKEFSDEAYQRKVAELYGWMAARAASHKPWSC